MEFLWNDGGRSSAGYVGLAGDCVTRAIAIATGRAYRDIYEEFGVRCLKTPRNGVDVTIAAEVLNDIGWIQVDCEGHEFAGGEFPKGVVIFHLCGADGRGRHLCTVVDQVLHDTWNPSDDAEYQAKCYWTPPVGPADGTLPAATSGVASSAEQELTQNQFDKILRRLRALDNTASNSGSTEGEKHNALRMMQSLMLTHNLSRSDITDEDNVENVHFTRIACPLNGRRACGWEKQLAWYVSHEVFTSVQWYTGTRAHRTFFWFYGPTSDVQNCIELFRELVLTIATAAKLQYGGYSRGSGASYCGGYVQGLPRAGDVPEDASEDAVSGTAPTSDQRQLVLNRTLALHSAAADWLAVECDTRLVTTTRTSRRQHDPNAEGLGKQHGAKHEISSPNRPLRLS